jgi:hypothetical protein
MLASTTGRDWAEPGLQVAHYRLFLFDHRNHIADQVPIEAQDDLDAFDRTFAQLSYYDIELWQGARLIIRIPRAERARS